MNCPTPDKMEFRSKVDALIKAKSVSDWYGTKMGVYPCQCGRWHLSTVSDSDDEQPSVSSS